jgi:hypothetical protein
MTYQQSPIQPHSGTLYRALGCGIAGVIMGIYAYKQGYGSFVVLLLTMTIGPLLLGFLIERRMVLLSIILNLGAVFGVWYTGYQFRRDHGFTIQRNDEIQLLAILGTIAVSLSFLALLPNAIRKAKSG